MVVKEAVKGTPGYKANYNYGTSGLTLEIIRVPVKVSCPDHMNIT